MLFLVAVALGLSVSLGALGILFVAMRYFRSIPKVTHPPRRHIHPWLQLSATQISKKLQEGEVTSAELVELCIEQIEASNPHLNAVVFDRFAEARQEASEADSILARARKKKSFAGVGWLTGVPCTIKEVFAVKGCPQSAGLPARKHYRCDEDSVQVQRLRAAGAIILGVTNTSELCMWMESSNHVYGTTHNAFDVHRIVGGSSGGEGCAQSAYYGFFGLGSDIGGSIRMPSYFCGIFGHKPSTRLVPNDVEGGQHPGCKDKGNFLLCTGPMCRHAEDLFPLLCTLSMGGWDEGMCHKQYPRCPPVAARDPHRIKLSRLRIYCIPDLGIPLVHAWKDQQAATLAAAHALKDKFGCSVHFVDWKKPQSVPKGWEVMRRGGEIWAAMGGEDSVKFEELMSEGKKEYRRWVEFFKCVVGLNKEHTFPATGLCVLESIVQKLETKEQREKTLAIGKQLMADIERELGTDGVIVTPTYPTTVPKHHRPLFLPLRWIYTAVFNALQGPATAVPIWYKKGQTLPLGVQCVASWGSDDVGLAVALALEQCFGGFHSPSWCKGVSKIAPLVEEVEGPHHHHHRSSEETPLRHSTQTTTRRSASKVKKH